ncbi:site-specific integrase [Chitinophaga rhizophila]|uniref:Site-specific integrase n=1 Tax=Chitinophaga rhizophila TaxID=2866212 RepID=A0ABS7GHU7_9BACT|nr:site-specific integrase [Chitinophaga rhizophila]MBW8687278.1 site-specific integrase [Chitinophaga rhizophila]
MIESSYAFYPFLRTDPRAKNPRTYLYLRITVDGEEETFSTHEVWDKERWDMNKRRAVGPRADAKALNEYIDSLRVQATMAKNRLINTNKRITAAAILAYMRGEADECKGALELFKAHNETMEKLVEEGEYASGTLDKYRQAFSHTTNFIEQKFGRDDIQLRELNYAFIEDFYNYMRITAKCAQNTSVKALSNFKKIILNAVTRGYLLKDPFAGFKLTRKDGKKKAINKAQLKAVMDKVFKSERLDKVRDWFVFSCYTGLAYIDIKNLRRSDLVDGMDGKKWIMLDRQKTDAPTRLPLLPVALSIVEKYWKDASCIENGKLFPIPSNQKINDYLKEIGALCEIELNLTFHIARHTFATTVTLKNGVPMETVKILLAHASIKETERYSIVDEEKVMEDMEKLSQRLHPDIYDQSLKALGDMSNDPANVRLVKIIQMAVDITMDRLEQRLKEAV